jgi:hemerythrin-like domain-containing protein
MGIDFPGLSSPAAGFEVPLEMLAACHERIRHQCETLQRLATHLVDRGADEEASTAASAVLKYFDTAAKLHHQDEEVDLFPALIESMAGSDAVCLQDMIRHLAVEHRKLEGMWTQISHDLRRVSTGQSQGLDKTAVDGFVASCLRHIDYEESELLPMAARLLTTAQLDEVGRAMRERRGVSLPT